MYEGDEIVRFRLTWMEVPLAYWNPCILRGSGLRSHWFNAFDHAAWRGEPAYRFHDLTKARSDIEPAHGPPRRPDIAEHLPQYLAVPF
jgi:hypothetical protein